MARIYELRQKEIINIKDGSRYGYVADMEIDEEEGRIKKIIVPGPARIFGVFGREQEYHIPWDCIKQIGEDIILVDVETEKALSGGD
jgi:YlmC/YmxH family sporulation protein